MSFTNYFLDFFTQNKGKKSLLDVYMPSIFSIVIFLGSSHSSAKFMCLA